MCGCVMLDFLGNAQTERWRAGDQDSEDGAKGEDHGDEIGQRKVLQIPADGGMGVSVGVNSSNVHVVMYM